MKRPILRKEDREMLTLIIIVWVLWELCRPRYYWYHRPPMGFFGGWHRPPMHHHRPMGGFGGMHMGGMHMGGFGGAFGGGRTMGGGAGRGRR